MRFRAWVSGRVRGGFPAVAVPMLLPAASARAEENLVAPACPGAQRLSPQSVKGRDRVVFASRDPHEKVQAFYRTKGTHLAKGSDGEFSGQKNTATPDNFALWKQCLVQASAYAYLTRISIHRHPSLWSY